MRLINIVYLASALTLLNNLRKKLRLCSERRKFAIGNDIWQFMDGVAGDGQVSVVPGRDRSDGQQQLARLLPARSRNAVRCTVCGRRPSVQQCSLGFSQV